MTTIPRPANDARLRAMARHARTVRERPDPECPCANIHGLGSRAMLGLLDVDYDRYVELMNRERRA